MELNESFYKHLVDAILEGVYFVNRDGAITYWNQGAERITGFASEQAVGMRCCDLLVHVDEGGRDLCKDLCLLEATMADGRERTAEVYCHHKDGHRIPVLIRTAPIRSGQDQIIGGVQVFTDNSAKLEFASRLKELEELVLLDALTLLPNRRFIELTLQERLSSLKRYGVQFGLMMLDIDRFKLVNDSYGHLVGDRVLKMASRTLAVNLRAPDFIGRWGGEEFVAILPYASREQLSSVASRLCHLVEQSGLKLGDRTVSVTVSVGATEARVEDSPETLLERVDHLLYLSKQEGRNRASVD